MKIWQLRILIIMQNASLWFQRWNEKGANAQKYHNHNCDCAHHYEGCSINKLQNGAILLISKYKKTPKYRFCTTLLLLRAVIWQLNTALVISAFNDVMLYYPHDQVPLKLLAEFMSLYKLRHLVPRRHSARKIQWHQFLEVSLEPV